MLNTEPKRIQRKRTKGWTSPEGAVYVGRPSIYANPYRIEKRPDGVMILRNPDGIRFASCPDRTERSLAVAHDIVTSQFAAFVNTETLDPGVWSVEAYERWCRLRGALKRGELRGKDLSCWCAPSLACHADVLLIVANGGAA